jgi:hypothetical protein
MQDRDQPKMKTMKMPRFVPTKKLKKEKPVPVFTPQTPAKVVVTVRLDPRARDKLHLIWRNEPGFESVSHVIQTAVDEFLAKRG